MPENISEAVLGKLRADLVSFKASSLYQEVAAPKQAVLARFQPLFSQERISQVTSEEFQNFLLIKNNRHWSGLHRYGSRMCADMKTLREGLQLLLDETKPLAGRLDSATELVHGMGKNVASAILLVVHPEKYGVWNNRSEAVLKQMGVWPTFDRGESFGRRYMKVNQMLLQLRDKLETDLWTLDGLWWFLDQDENPPEADEPILDDETGMMDRQRFGLERHLHAFLRDNWDSLELAREWAIYSEPGEEEKGCEYPTEVGRIDILAKHRREPGWLVIELKKESSTDKAIGQLLRYMGWVRKHLAEPGDRVRGMIISREVDRRVLYALDMVSAVEYRTYDVQFSLKTPPPMASETG